MEKRNFKILMEQQINELREKPKLLLHSCCAPCSSYVLEYLSGIFDITVFYYNPNMDSKEEFDKRAEEQVRLIKEMGIDAKCVVVPYDKEEFNSAVKGLEDAPEGGARCLKCFKLRLEKCGEYARANNFDYFTTTLTISPHKNAEVINKVCEEISEKYGVKNLYSDFKKNNGYKRSCELSEAFGLYRQNYCGCVYSKKVLENCRDL